jgi:ATP-dependent DNA ligase
MLQRTLPSGFIAPCLPTKTHKLPAGGQWLHEIKHDGFRVIARKDGDLDVMITKRDRTSAGAEHRRAVLGMLLLAPI